MNDNGRILTVRPLLTIEGLPLAGLQASFDIYRLSLGEVLAEKLVNLVVRLIAAIDPYRNKSAEDRFFVANHVANMKPAIGNADYGKMKFNFLA